MNMSASISRLMACTVILAGSLAVSCQRAPDPIDVPAALAQQPADDAGETAAGPAANDESKESREAHKPATQQAAVRTYPANRLADETSPYLLMHAHNPVQWYPWGDEALAKARRENKLIFLSVGYSSCYWCHVMERESFMDEEIAGYMNKNFVCIKVDREERPDVDDIYMTAVQLITRRGGWPLSAFLTPDAKPFYGGTYFPARAGDRGARVGFLDVLHHMHDLWKDKAETVQKGADQVASALKQALREKRPERVVALDASLQDNVMASLSEEFDPTFGGFGFMANNPDVPKFPTPPNLMFLVDRAGRADDAKAREMLLLTLEKMAQGGIWDHWGGGFHRYSTDRYWRIPHFEKMLYDNGQLATVYAEAYEVTGRDDFRRVVDELLEFVLREMTDPDGGFYCAIDAETDAEEGKFYRWTQKELRAVIPGDDWDLMARIYNLGGAPNFEGEYYVPYRTQTFPQIAKDLKRTEKDLQQAIAPLRQRLLAARDRRKRPLTDTKILTSWNGLMVQGFADAGRILEEPRYVEAAARAADFVLDKLRTKDGRLLRTYRQGDAKLNAYLDDYSFMVAGLIALYRATGQQRWLETAAQLTDKQLELFWDDEDGGFYFTSGDHEQLIARAKQQTDSVLPSGNAIAAQNLVFLAGALSREDYLQRARETIQAFAHGLNNTDRAGNMPAMAVAAAELLEAEKR